MKLKTQGTTGSISEGNELRGLWFASISDARNSPMIQMCIASEERNGLKTSMADWDAATTGRCDLKPGP